MSMPDNRGTTGRDGSARATKATASPSASRPTVNFISTILALATDISERKAFANPGHLRKARSRQPGGRGSKRRLDRAGQVLAEEGLDLLPALDRRLDPVGRADNREESVPCSGEGAELMRLAQLVEGAGQFSGLG